MGVARLHKPGHHGDAIVDGTHTQAQRASSAVCRDHLRGVRLGVEGDRLQWGRIWDNSGGAYGTTVGAHFTPGEEYAHACRSLARVSRAPSRRRSHHANIRTNIRTW